MGDPGKIRRKYDTPSHPWQRTRIEEERGVLKEYGLKNKKEIWKAETMLRDFKNQAKGLASRVDAQSKKEEKQLIDRLISMGLLKHGDSLDTVLGLNLKSVLDRRLQTFLVKKAFSRTHTQARQFITHGHILIGEKKITFPSYFVTVKDEGMVQFMPKSTLSKEDHPERALVGKESSADKAKRLAAERKHKKAAEDLPAFNEKEIDQIEKTGAVEPATEVEAEN
jgi:small subunit ribosomal protein S4